MVAQLYRTWQKGTSILWTFSSSPVTLKGFSCERPSRFTTNICPAIASKSVSFTGKTILWRNEGFQLGKWGYPHSWMVFVRGNPIKRDDEQGHPYDLGNPLKWWWSRWSTRSNGIPMGVSHGWEAKPGTKGPTKKSISPNLRSVANFLAAHHWKLDFWKTMQISVQLHMSWPRKWHGIDPYTGETCLLKINRQGDESQYIPLSLRFFSRFPVVLLCLMMFNAEFQQIFWVLWYPHPLSHISY